MSRIGKIARLPKPVREELNRRLEDGEQQNRLVEWLNGREDVQAVLKAEFDGRPINEPNMTAWAQGGYEDWRRQEEAMEAAGRMVEETSELDALTKDRRLADRAADMAALALGEQLMALRRMEDGTEKRRAVLKIVRGLVRLRKSDREHERGQREAAHATRSADIHADWMYERARRRMLEEDRFDHLSDGKLMRRITDLRAMGGGAPATVDEWDDEDGRSTGLGQTQRLEDEEDGGQETEDSGRMEESEDEHVDVRERMAEVIEGLSDEQIEESLRRGGYLKPRPPKAAGQKDEGQRSEDPPSPSLRRAGDGQSTSTKGGLASAEPMADKPAAA